jgi:hypothetical protein
MKDFELKRIMQPHLIGHHIVPGSTPVTSFGNPHTSRIATLGINPSSREFLNEAGTLLGKEEKRLTDLEMLRKLDQPILTESDAEQVISGCYNYFKTGNHYPSWFNAMEEFALAPMNATYFGDTPDACHLDLVQWATNPVWDQIDEPEIKANLLKSDKEFLHQQLTHYRFERLLLNGRTVINNFNELNLCTLREIAQVSFGNGEKKSKIYLGKFESTEVIAWGLNIPAKESTPANRAELAQWLREYCLKA